jgi:hypothetical protein
MVWEEVLCATGCFAWSLGAVKKKGQSNWSWTGTTLVVIKQEVRLQEAGHEEFRKDSDVLLVVVSEGQKVW